MTSATNLSAEEARAWDALAVDRPGGHVYQSVAWAEHRSRSGWVPRFIARDALRVLCLTRPWPIVAGGSAYVPRGPAPPGDGATAAAALELATATLEADGVDVVAADAEVPATDTAYRATLERLRFRAIEEIQPSRHRVTLPLASGTGEGAAFENIAKSSRQRIRQAERAGTIVVRHDARADEPDEGFVGPTESTDVALDRFYDLLLATGERLHFSFGPRTSFVAWWRAAHAAGHLVLLEARLDAAPIAGLVLYRHGERLSTVHSGDRAESRRDHPGALHLLRWRAIQLAIREGRAEMDLGGADVPGARREPREGDSMYGLYQHKLSFGGRWLELAGAHERVSRRWRYMAGRIAARVVRR
jgi:GNAT acetyltransferase-like protein